MGRRPGRPAPDPRKVARALVLHRQDKTLVEIGQELGFSAETARNYILLAKNAERWLPAYDRAAIAANVTGILLELKVRGLARLEERDAEYEKVVPALIAVIRTLIDVHGLRAPTRVDITTTPEAHPDPAIMAQLRAEGDAIAAADLAEITGRN